MKYDFRLEDFVYTTLAALILVILAIYLLDIPLASWIAKFPMGHSPHARYSNIPDSLFTTVVILASLSWMAYFYFVRQQIHNQHRQFCRVIGTVLPLSFGIKTVLKWLFGGIETRTWLSNPGQYGFHWFAGKDGFQGFPSGHMLVMTPLFLALWHFYPRYRLQYGVIWFSLGATLILTEYHFLSDVLAGAYIGALLYFVVSSRMDRLLGRSLKRL
jgi:membrane-associated phospholipid phosphatase